MKKLFFIILILVSFACSSFAGETGSPPRRIISLAPNVTEILFALGLGDHIVGVTSFCDYPPEAKKKAKIGGMSNPSIEAVITLKPDIVVVTTDGNPEEFEERLRSLNIKTFVFTARRLAELPGGVRELGKALGVPGRAEQLAREIEVALVTAGSKGKGQGTRGDRELHNSEHLTLSSELKRTKVLFIVWPEPLIVAGPKTAMDDAIKLLGQENIASSARLSYPKYSLEEVIGQGPEVMIIGKASGMDMREVSKGILQRLSSVPAVKNGKVCYVGDNLYRLGPRIVKGIEELAECLK